MSTTFTPSPVQQALSSFNTTHKIVQSFHQLNQYAIYGVITERQLQTARLNLIAHIVLNSNPASTTEITEIIADTFYLGDIFVYSGQQLFHEVIAGKAAFLEMDRIVCAVANKIVKAGGVFDSFHTEVSGNSGYAVDRIVGVLADYDDDGEGWVLGRGLEGSKAVLVAGNGFGVEGAGVAYSEEEDEAVDSDFPVNYEFKTVGVDAMGGSIISTLRTYPVEVEEDEGEPRTFKEMLMDTYIAENISNFGTYAVTPWDFKAAFLKWATKKHGVSFSDFEVRNLPEIKKGYWR